MKNALICFALTLLAVSVQAQEVPGAKSCPCVRGDVNLVKNGDFSLGNTGFTSDLTYVAPGSSGSYTQLTAGKYTIATSGINHNGQWLCSPVSATQFLVADGATTDKVAWRQTITVQKGKKYNFCVQANNLQRPTSGSSYKEPVVKVLINGVQLIAATTLKRLPDAWQLLSAQWTANAATAKVEIVNIGVAGAGNDFALDDVSFGLLPTLPSSFNITTQDVNPSDAFYNLTATAVNNTSCANIYFTVCELSNPANPASVVSNTLKIYPNVNTTNFPGFANGTPGIFQVGKHYRIMRIVRCACYQESSSTMIVSFTQGLRQAQTKEVNSFALPPQELKQLEAIRN
ncbi:MAG: hypothetical protein J0L99_09915 [Chitinophagales bacterium]|nr:hypothetical protein [Chitinophagales bacterium]